MMLNSQIYIGVAGRDGALSDAAKNSIVDQSSGSKKDVPASFILN